MLYKPTNFWSTVVKPYYIKEEILDVPEQEDQVNRSDNEKEPNEQAEPVDPEPIVRRGRGRPKGSRNKDVSKEIATRRSTRHHFADKDNSNQAFLTIEEIDTQMTLMAFMTSKEQANMALALKLRKEVFNFIQWDPVKHAGVRIFNSRIVHEVKGKATDTPYKKSRLVIQAYNNNGKEIILI